MHRASAFLVFLIALNASAGWTALTVPVAPQDVNAWAPGEWTISAVGAGGAFKYSGSTLDAGLPGLVVKGTGLTSTGCLAALDENGELYFACPTTTSPSPSLWFGGGALALKSTPDAGAFALQNSGADINVCYAVDGPEPLVVPVCSAVFGLVPSDVLAAHRSGGTDYAAFGREGNSFVFVSTATATPTQTPITTPGKVEAMELFGQNGSVSALYSTLDAGLFAVDLSGTPLPQGLSLPAGLSRVSGISYAVGTGDPQSGDGFGVALGHGTATHQLLSAVPAISGAQLGREWIPSTAPPAIDLSGFTRVDCSDAKFCVAIRPVSGMPNVLLYENLSPPALMLSAPSVQVQPGATASVTAQASDSDGDALRISWRKTSGLAVDFVADGGLLELDTSALPMCQSGSAIFEARATDGLASHVQSANLTVQISPSVPNAPTVTPFSSVIEAGAPVLTMEASSSGAQSYEWKPRVGAQAVVVDGGSAYFVPAETSCAAQVHEYDVHAIGTCGPSAPTPVQVTVNPFGRPLAPFSSVTTYSVDAGTTFRLTPEAKHLCASAPVATTWEVQGSLPPGMQLVREDGVVGTGAFDSSFVDFVSEECSAITPQTLSLLATNRTVGSVSEPRSSTLTIDVTTQLAPFDDATLSLTAPTLTSGEARGTIEVGGINCAEARGLTSELKLLRAADGALVGSTRPAAPGTYSVPLPNACEAGDFRLAAQLFDSSGTPGATTELSFSTPRLNAAIGEPSASILEVSCGVGLRSRVSVAEVEGACNAGALSWEQQSGPALETPVLQGREVELVGSSQDLSALIGQTVTMRVTSNAATDNVAIRDVAFQLTTQPFLSVAHGLARPVTEDSELVEIVARISNPSDCGVGNVTLVEQLEGLTPVGSFSYSYPSPNFPALIQRPITPVPLNERAWALQGISIPARGTIEVRYFAQPSLLGEARVQGLAELNGVPLSELGYLANDAGAGGCGCSSSSGASVAGLSWVLLLGLVLARKRRVKTPTECGGTNVR